MNYECDGYLTWYRPSHRKKGHKHQIRGEKGVANIFMWKGNRQQNAMELSVCHII